MSWSTSTRLGATFAQFISNGLGARWYVVPVAEEIDLLVLASSKKHGGRCIAGWDVANDRWVRPVSSAPDGTLDLSHCAIDGDWPQVLDVVRVSVDAHRPVSYQPENYVIVDRPWRRIERVASAAALQRLAPLVDHQDWMFDDGDRRVDEAGLKASPAPSSLALARPADIGGRLEAFMGGRQIKTTFHLPDRGRRYEFNVTDPEMHGRLSALNNGSHDRRAVGLQADSDVFYLVSLGEPYNGKCFKLVAGVIEISR